jgi:hypothetical protein
MFAALWIDMQCTVVFWLVAALAFRLRGAPLEQTVAARDATAVPAAPLRSPSGFRATPEAPQPAFAKT